MRKVVLLIAAVVVALTARAQTIKLVSPTAINIPVSGRSANLRVFYQAPDKVKIAITDVGKLEAPTEIGFLKNAPQRPASFVIAVRLKEPLKEGETHSGAIVFTPPPGKGDPVTVAVTVSRPAPVFTATVVHEDICLDCDEPAEAAIKITNSGSVPIAKVAIGMILMSDNGRRHRVITKESPGVAVSLAPGQTRTITVPLTRPAKAGDYSTTIELSTEGAPTVTASLVVRARGPNRGPGPFVLFLATLVIGTVAAYLFEWWSGSGGGAERAKALIGLADTYGLLARLRDEVAKDPQLGNTLRRITTDLESIELLQQQVGRRTPAELTAAAALFDLIAKKREQLRKYVLIARTTQKERWVPLLDAAPDVDGETESAYEARLKAILEGPPPTERTLETVANDRQDIEAMMKSRTAALRRQRLFFRALRGAILFILVLGTALGLFYMKGCNFGGWQDYLALFVWALSLTGAGAALVNQVTRPS